jgi:hypothetical protein
MPRNGSGTYNLPSGNPVVSYTVIRAQWANLTMSDIATALTGSIARDGQSAPTANLPMAGFRFTNVGAGASLTDLARVSQVQDGSLLRCSAEAMPSSDAYTANLPFGTTSFGNGQVIVLTFPSANTTSSVTLNLNSGGARPILRQDGSAIQPGDCRAGVPSQLIWNTSAWLVLGTVASSAAGVSTFNTRTGAVTLLSADVTTALGYSPVQSFNTRTGTVTLLSADVLSALGYTPANKAGETFTGPVILNDDATDPLGAVTLQQMAAAIAASVAGVASFNTRTGAVSLLSADVTTALGYSPVQSFNTRTGAVVLLSGDVTSALGYSPVQSFNSRTGVVTLSSSDVTTALGYTPFNKAGDTATYEREAKVAVGNVSGSQVLDWSLGGVMTATVTGSGATFTHTNLPSGVVGYLTLDLTNGGVATSITTLFGSSVKLPGGASLYSLTASGRDILTFMCHDGATINVVGFAKGMA